MEKNKILVIEDEYDIRLGLKTLLEEHYQIDLAENGLTGIKSALRNKPNLILLDLNMPELDGFQTCKALRSETEFNNTPIVILTAYNDINERTKAFELGADDYIAKPFDNAELLTRIKRKINTFSHTKNNSPALSEFNNTIICGNMKLNIHTKHVLIGEKIVDLSALEFKLLYYFVQNSEKLLSRKDIIDNVWEKQEVSDRIIDPHILSLRGKIEGSTHMISSVYRAGYILKSLI